MRIYSLCDAFTSSADSAGRLTIAGLYFFGALKVKS
ncbi:hypothetical protein BFJ68_g17494 [Fusarium oxysporum]|uniref:Uncharacterized protein n=1 Tax=Fusarium oxysporum TaxID=5507 RepID=A0A420NRJ3_FUSOX|nr:hypothetical protein BFJ68_g17494 [Fusarium oxysporum]